MTSKGKKPATNVKKELPVVANIPKKESSLTQNEEKIELSSDGVKFFGIVPVPNWAGYVSWCLINLVRLALLAYAGYLAYEIRTYAIRDFGRIIHEFDPWFNFRATEYLEREGWSKFFSWFDYESWYPLGRPVGTTIYPGMQITAVAIYRVLGFLGENTGLAWLKMSLNDVCVFIPCWFGVLATIFLSLLTYECSGSANAGVLSAFVMAIIPAHIMRSVGGGFDNESVAMSAMIATFYFWCRSLRTEKSWPVGIITGLAYIYMVAAWGGYIFVVNMVGVHAAFLLGMNLLRGVHSSSLYKAYSLFFVIGTFGATHVPVVGMSPFKSLEQLGPFLVFIIFQLLEFCYYYSQKKQYKIGSWSHIKVQLAVFAVSSLILAAIVHQLLPTGYFGPLSARVRGLFLKHTRTGNPLVDSVAEHQPSSPETYQYFLHHSYYTTIFGFGLLVLYYPKWTQTTFLMLFTLITYYFCSKMSRLLLLLGPAASALSGIGVGLVLDWCIDQIFVHSPNIEKTNPNEGYISKFVKKVRSVYHHKAFYYTFRLIALVGIVYLSYQNFHYAVQFKNNCYEVAEQFGEPHIMIKYQDPKTKKMMIIDDYYKGYLWLRDKTPKDSRVMAWWDYGYQITGIGQRTTIADGNTWNHEHIATLGYCLSAPTAKAHNLIRHLADYVLVWSGEYQDDLAKSPHMARIGNSVYPGVCPRDPTCEQFGFTHRDQHGRLYPTPMMEKSLLFNLIKFGLDPKAKVDPKYFKQVYKSPNDLMRIFKVMNVSQESKEWVANPANRQCDHPGSWYCTGQYPPAEPIQALLKKKQDFKQLEDFNKGEKDLEYHQEYMKRMAKGGE